jgi:hypothetical protein
MIEGLSNRGCGGKRLNKAATDGPKKSSLTGNADDADTKAGQGAKMRSDTFCMQETTRSGAKQLGQHKLERLNDQTGERAGLPRTSHSTSLASDGRCGACTRPIRLDTAATPIPLRSGRRVARCPPRAQRALHVSHMPHQAVPCLGRQPIRLAGRRQARVPSAWWKGRIIKSAFITRPTQLFYSNAARKRPIYS